MDTGKYKKAMRKKKYLDGNFVVYDKNLPEIGEVPKASATDVWNAIKKVSTGEDKKEVEAIENRYKKEVDQKFNAIGQRIVDYSKTYDDNSPYTHDPISNTYVQRKDFIEGPLDKKVREGKELTKEEAAYMQQDPFKVRNNNNNNNNKYGLTKEAFNFVKRENSPPVNKEIKKPIKTSTPVIRDLSMPEAVKRAEVNPEPKEPEFNLDKYIREKAAASLKADEENARKQGGIVWLNWRNPIIK